MNVDPATPTFIISPGGRDLSRATEAAAAARAIGRRVVAVAPASASTLREAATHLLPLAEDVPEVFSPLLAAIPGELFAAYRAEGLGEPLFRPSGGVRAPGINRVRTSETWDAIERRRGRQALRRRIRERAMFLSIGPVVIDDIVLPDGQTRMGTLGGGATHAAMGMRVWSGRVALLATLGRDVPEPDRRKLARAFDLRSLARGTRHRLGPGSCTSPMVAAPTWTVPTRTCSWPCVRARTNCRRICGRQRCPPRVRCP